MDDNEVKLLEILKETLKVNPKKVDDVDSAKTIKNWNSMTHMKLIARIEKEFSIKFNINDIIQIQTIGDLKKLLADYK